MTSWLKAAATLVLLSLSSVLPAAATIYYVDRSIGSDSNTGLGQTAGAGGPLFSIQGALNKALVGGDHVQVKNVTGTGIYTENLQLSKSGTQGNPIIIENFQGHAPIIDTGTFTPTFPLPLSVVQRRFYVYSGVSTPTHDVMISGFEIRNGYEGIKVEVGDRITIKDNWIHDTYSQGILAPAVNTGSIFHNRFTRIGIGWKNAGCPDANTGATLFCNQVHGIYNTGQGWLIYNNIFEETVAGWGIQAAAYGPTDYPTYPTDHLGWTGTIANNTFAYGRNFGSITVYKSSAPNAVVIENNLFYENAQLSLGPSQSQGIDFYNTGPGHTVRNNHFWATAPGVTAPISSCNNTGCFNPNGLGWYTDGGGNVFNVSSPNMLNAPASIPALPDYHLNTGSSAAGIGLNLSSLFTTDYDLLTRQPTGTNWDAGAYALLGTTRFISLGGHGETSVTDTNSCATSQSILTPKRTFVSALSCINPGDTLYIRDAVYAEQINLMSPRKNGTAGKYIIIAGYPTDTAPVLRRTSSPDLLGPIANQALDASTKTEYQIFRHLVLDGINEANLSGWQHKTNGAGQTPDGAVDSGYYHDVILDDIEYKNFPLNMYAEANNLTIRNSKLHDQRSVSGLSGERWYGTYFRRGANFLYENNDVYNNPGGGLQLYCGVNTTGITITNAIVRNNRLHDNNFLAAGVSSQGGMIIYGPCFSSVKVHDNLIYNNGSAPSQPTAPGIIVGSNASNIELDNNTIFGNRRGSGSNASGIDLQGPTSSTNVVLKGNILFGNIGTPQYSDLAIGTVTQGNIGIDLVADPLFNNAAALDFSLKAGSPARSYAPNLISLYQTDFAGIARPLNGNWDAGALQSLSSGRTFYVDRLLPGSDSNNGTSEVTPWLNIQRCTVVAILPDDTCLVKNGTYSADGLINIPAPGGTRGHPITYQNYPGHTPRITSSDMTNTQNRFGSFLPSATCTGGSPPGWLVIRGFEIDHVYNGIKLDCHHDVLIEGNHIHDTWYPGIQVAAGLNVTVNANRVHHAGDFTGTADPTTGQTHTHCFYLNGTGYTITNNVIYDCYLYGMQLKSTLLGDATSSPAPSQSYVSFGGLVANNTIAYTNTRGGITVYRVGGTIDTLTIENNLFYENSQTSDGTAQGVHWYGGSCSPCVATVRNNLWYATGNSVRFTMTQDSTSTPEPAGVTETNTTFANPLFVNGPATLPTSPDFHLSVNPISPATGIGLNLAGLFTNKDFDGFTRPAGNWADGAYEPAVQPDTTPPAANTGFRVR